MELVELQVVRLIIAVVVLDLHRQPRIMELVELQVVRLIIAAAVWDLHLPPGIMDLVGEAQIWILKRQLVRDTAGSLVRIEHQLVIIAHQNTILELENRQLVRMTILVLDMEGSLVRIERQLVIIAHQNTILELENRQLVRMTILVLDMAGSLVRIERQLVIIAHQNTILELENRQLVRMTIVQLEEALITTLILVVHAKKRTIWEVIEDGNLQIIVQLELPEIPAEIAGLTIVQLGEALIIIPILVAHAKKRTIWEVITQAEIAEIQLTGMDHEIVKAARTKLTIVQLGEVQIIIPILVAHAKKRTIWEVITQAEIAEIQLTGMDHEIVKAARTKPIIRQREEAPDMTILVAQEIVKVAQTKPIIRQREEAPDMTILVAQEIETEVLINPKIIWEVIVDENQVTDTVINHVTRVRTGLITQAEVDENQLTDTVINHVTRVRTGLITQAEVDENQLTVMGHEIVKAAPIWELQEGALDMTTLVAQDKVRSMISILQVEKTQLTDMDLEIGKVARTRLIIRAVALLILQGILYLKHYLLKRLIT
jgi:hypothetical protein